MPGNALAPLKVLAPPKGALVVLAGLPPSRAGGPDSMNPHSPSLGLAACCCPLPARAINFPLVKTPSRRQHMGRERWGWGCASPTWPAGVCVTHLPQPAPVPPLQGKGRGAFPTWQSHCPAPRACSTRGNKLLQRKQWRSHGNYQYYDFKGLSKRQLSKHSSSIYKCCQDPKSKLLDLPF